MKQRLTIVTAESLDQGSLAAVCSALLAEYDSPDDPENRMMRLARVSRTIEEMPAIYRWFLELRSRYDAMADETKEQFGQGHVSYKTCRQKRDLFENFARAARMRYEAASRLITVEQGFDPEEMPTHRKGS